MTILDGPSGPLASPSLQDDESNPTVTREAGTFVRLSGSETVFAFEPVETESIIAAFEWNEVSVFRKIRGIIRSQGNPAVSSTNRSLYLFIATLLAKALAIIGNPNWRFVHHGVRYSPFFEAFKLVTEMREGQVFHHDFLCKSIGYLKNFKAIHERFDIQGAQVNKIVSVEEGGRDPVDTLIRKAMSADLIFLDTFRDGGAELETTIDKIVEQTGTAMPDILLIAKGSWSSGIHVHDVFENEFDLLSMHWMVEFCGEKDLTCHYIELASYDRESLLPFDGDYSVFVIYFSRIERAGLTDAGFKRLEATRPAASRELVPVRGLVYGSNYYTEITGEIPVLDDYEEPNWHAWKQARDWDPAAAKWGNVRFALEMDLLSHTMRWFDQPNLDLIVKAIEHHGLNRALSPRMAMVNALEKLASNPVDAIFFVLLSFEIASYDANTMRYLLMCLRRDLNVKEPEGGSSLNLPGNTDITATVHGAFQYLTKLDIRFGDTRVLERIPRVVDALYGIRGADRSRFLRVRAAVETL